MDLREIGCEDGRWMELAQDRVQWRALVLAVLNLQLSGNASKGLFSLIVSIIKDTRCGRS
jgi:hypothetical protein